MRHTGDVTSDVDPGITRPSSATSLQGQERLDRGVNLHAHLSALRTGIPIWLPIAVIVAVVAFLWTSAQAKTYATTGSLRVSVAGDASGSSDSLASQVAAVALSDRVLDNVTDGAELRKTGDASAAGTIVTVTVRGSNQALAQRQVNSIITQTARIYATDPSSVSSSLSSNLDTITQQAQNGTSVTGRLSKLSDDLRNGRFSRVSILDRAWTDPDTKQPSALRNAFYALLGSGVVAAEITAITIQRRRRQRPARQARSFRS